MFANPSWKDAPAAVGLAVLLAASGAAIAAPELVDVAASVGLTHRFAAPADAAMISPMTGGAAAGDFNRDGWQDLFVLSGGHQPDRLFINNGDGTFTDMAAAWGVDAVHLGSGVSVADFDGDGWLDMFVTSSGATDAPAPGGHKLYRNLGGTGFVDVADAAGVRFTGYIMPDGQSSAWGDYDLDGDLDLAVAGWAKDAGGNRLFRNNGDGTFTDVTTTAILHDMTPVRGFNPRFSDMDGDTYPELLWVADYDTSRYLINNGDGTFSDFTDGSGTGTDSNGMGATTGDFDNDGLLDWYITSIWQDTIPWRRGNQLYINNGDHTYTEISQDAGVANGGWGWGAEFIDIDQDGWLDIFETNGWDFTEWQGENSYLWINRGNYTCWNAGTTAGVADGQLGRGLVRMDYDNDGDMDIVIISTGNGGGIGFPEIVEGGNLFLYENRVNQNESTGWLRIFLDTSDSANLAPDGIGAHVILTAGGLTQHRWVNANPTFLSQSEMSAHFGLDGATTIDEVRIIWPNGLERVITDVAINRTVTFVSCAADFTGDTVLDSADVGAFVRAYITGERSADLDASGSLDFFDVFAFLTAFSTDCAADR